MSEREMLLRKLQACDFALNEANLFLDANPGNQEALRYYKQHLEMRAAAHKAYVAKYGPVTRYDCEGSAWKWTEGPWPWQLAEEA